MNSPSPHRPPPVTRGSGSSTTHVVPEARPTPYTPRCTPDEYIQAIAHHSQQTSADTLYPGEIYDTLNRFLDQKSSGGAPRAGNHAPNDFAWLISPGQTGQQVAPDSQPVSDSTGSRGQSEGFADPKSCIRALRSNIEISHPQVLFLRGHPSPSWLASIGAFCYVDPELFRWFLRYRSEPGTDYYFDSAPSVMSKTYRFKFYTIGTNNSRYRSSQKEVDDLRVKAADNFQRYRNDLRLLLRPGNSIVRNFHVLDQQHCVIVQEIVISIFDVGKTWMAIACTDAGHDLTRGPQLPWLGEGAEALPITLLPIVQYRPRCALKSRGINESKPAGSRRGANTQSLAVFPEGYGRGLDWSLAKSDRFHVLSDIFRLAAFSQNQLLNVMKEKIAVETAPLRPSNEKPTLVNLLYCRDILQEQISDISRMLLLTHEHDTILHNGRRTTAVNNAVAEVHSLLQDNYSHAQTLQEKCTQGMSVISNNGMLEESQRAIQQAKVVTKLTLVAFVYLPFTFTASFFGMNVRELGTGTSPMWKYFAASLPLMFLTVMLFVLDVQTVRTLLQAMHIKGRHKT